MTDDEFFKVWIATDGIMYGYFPQPVHIDIQNMKRIIDIRHDKSNNERQYVCYDASNITSMTKEARDYSSIYGNELFYACAVIVKTRLQEYLFNIYSTLKKPDTPFRAFKSKTDAINWLKTFQ